MCFMGHIKADYQEYVFSEMMSNASTGKILGEPSEDDMTQLLLLGKFEYTGGPIFKVVLEC